MHCFIRIVYLCVCVIFVSYSLFVLSIYFFFTFRLSSVILFHLILWVFFSPDTFFGVSFSFFFQSPIFFSVKIYCGSGEARERKKETERSAGILKDANEWVIEIGDRQRIGIEHQMEKDRKKMECVLLSENQAFASWYTKVLCSHVIHSPQMKKKIVPFNRHWIPFAVAGRFCLFFSYLRCIEVSLWFFCFFFRLNRRQNQGSFDCLS